MRILLLYDNFIRDFRGLLLLKYLLKEKGHTVWMKATWNDPLDFASLMAVDMIIGGQVAEEATHHVGKFAKENKIRFVLNSTENVAIPSKFDLFITYNTSQFNDEIIDLQSIAARDVYEFIMSHPEIKTANKHKYKYLGFPRLDLTLNEAFRGIETPSFSKKYNLQKTQTVYLFISSFLLDSSYDGVPQKDLDRWNYKEMKKMTDHMLQVTTGILSRLVNEVLGEADVLLIKKHPWDCSSYFSDRFSGRKCIVLDNNDYILPCITNADFIIHTYTTAAIEAWISGKKTVSILLEEYRASATLNHMRHEPSVCSFEELTQLIENYPIEHPSLKSLEIFSPNLDGKATLRLVEEIDKIVPYPRLNGVERVPLRTTMVTKFWGFIQKIKSPLKKSRTCVLIREWLFDNGFIKYDVLKHAKPNTKNFDFYSWENDRPRVINLYRKAFKRYARQYVKKGL